MLIPLITNPLEFGHEGLIVFADGSNMPGASLILTVAIKVWHSYNKFENQVANVARQPYLAKI